MSESRAWLEHLERTQKLRPREIPDRFDGVVALSILDTFACALAAVRRSPTLSREMPQRAPGRASVWWTPWTTSAPEAAFANAYAAHRLDFDSVHHATFGHPAVVLLPALIALAEERGLSWRRLVRAYLLGHETMRILGDAFGVALRERSFHVTSVIGRLACAVAAGHLLGLRGSQRRAAMDLAGCGVSGFAASFGGPTKAYQVAMAVRAGVEATLWAKRVAQPTSTGSWWEGLQVLAGGEPGPLPSAIANSWSLDQAPMHFKMSPACAYFDQVVQRFLEVHHPFFATGDGVRWVNLELTEAVRLANRFEAPRTVDEARFSLPFVVAVAAHCGRVEPEHFAPRWLRDPAIEMLVKRVRSFPIPKNRRGLAARTTDGLEIVFESGRIVKCVARPQATAPAVVETRVLQKFYSIARGCLSAGEAETFVSRIFAIGEHRANEVARCARRSIPTRR